jgi:hypothetical protein
MIIDDTTIKVAAKETFEIERKSYIRQKLKSAMEVDAALSKSRKKKGTKL